MKLLIITIIGIILGLGLAPNSPHLFVYQPVQVTTEAHIDPPLDAEIIAQIAIEFIEHDRHTIKQLIDIAYAESGLRYNAYNFNSNGSSDYGVFQINSIHTKRFGELFKTDWKENIRVAHVIFDEQGLHPWVAAHKLGLVL